MLLLILILILILIASRAFFPLRYTMVIRIVLDGPELAAAFALLQYCCRLRWIASSMAVYCLDYCVDYCVEYV